MDKESERNPNSRLNIYLRSKGTQLPTDTWIYRPPQDNHALCLFCLHNHEYIEVKIREPRNLLAVKWVNGVHCCKLCNNEINKMENATIRHYAEENLFRKGYEGIRNEAVKRLQAYLEEGILETNYKDYVLHLDPRIEHADTSRYQPLCYGCQRTESPSGFIQAPQGKDPWVLDGGRLKLCASCSVELQLLEQDISEIAISPFEQDTCPHCHQEYAISMGESEMRMLYNTFGKHYCPKCAYINLTKPQPAKSFYVARRTDFDELDRYTFCSCEYCQDDIQIDLTLEVSYLTDKFVSPEGKRICKGCYQFGMAPTICYRSNPPGDGGMVWMFFQEKNKVIAWRRRAEEETIHETRKLSSTSLEEDLQSIIATLMQGKPRPFIM